MRYYLGIDIGTFESKAVLVDGSGAIVVQASHPHKMLVPQAGWAEHNAEEDWWGDFKRLSRSVIEKSGIDPRDIRAVGTSAIGPCMLPVDTHGNALMNGVLYGVDTRASREITELTQQYGEQEILRRCGNALTSQSVGPKILWLRRNRPDIYKACHKIVTSTTYIVQKLTGRTVIDHYSAANWTPLYMPEALGWSARMADGIIESDKLAEIVWTTDIAGSVTRLAAEATGLAEGTPVIAGTIDAASEAVSVGVLAPGEMMLMYGSTIFIILVTSARVDDARLWYAPWLFPGQHASMSGLATSGTLTHWFREQFARELDPAQAMATLAAEAARSPKGAKGLVMLPYFSGERTPLHDPTAKGVLFGMDLTHERGDIYRALLEGIAHGTHHILETYRDVGQIPERIEAVGGGTQNSTWAQATSDITGFAQNVRQKTMGASYGDAFLAAFGVGDVKREDILQWNPAFRSFDPDERSRDMYLRQHGVYRSIYERNKDLMQRLALPETG